MGVVVKAYGLLIKDTETLFSDRNGCPRLWKNLRGPAQLIGKGNMEDETYKIVVVKIEVIA